MARLQVDPSSVPSTLHNDASSSNPATHEGRCSSCQKSFCVCHIRLDTNGKLAPRICPWCIERDCPGFFHKSLCNCSSGSSNDKRLHKGNETGSASKPESSFASSDLFGTGSFLKGENTGLPTKPGTLFGRSNGLFGTNSSLDGENPSLPTKPGTLFGLSGGLFGTTSSLPGSKVDELNSKVDAIRSKIEALGSLVGVPVSKLDSLGYRVDNVDRKVDALDRKVDALSRKVDILAENITKAPKPAGI